jgi:phospholipid-translocating P-type ATPase (flippase)
MLALKTIDYKTFNKWYSNVKLATQLEEKIEKENELNKLYEEMETNLNLAGVSAIEDKLQDGVPETIELLLNSGIRVWVLTGDKKETALNIGRTCRLIEEIGFNDLDITSTNLDSNLNNINAEIEQKLDTFIGKLNISHVKKISELKNIKINEKYYMIVDGFSLIKIIECPKLSYKFLVAGLMCRSVICCRVSPKQKSDVVKIAKKLSNWITLSIGDGANDVPMIMEANIGVGIQGKEGSQAVRSADYAMCQFKFLQRLILVHGRNGYRRISKFICYYFYKNILLIFSEIYFVFFSGFSGQIFFPDILTLLYNVLWTSWPPILAFAIDKDIVEDKPDKFTQHNYQNNLIGKHFEIFPHFYKAGHINYYFTLRVFWKWIMSAVIHGGICFVSASFGFLDVSVFNNGKLVDHWWVATIIFTLIIHVVTYKIYVEMSYWNKLVVFISLFSVGFYYVCIVLLNSPMISYGFQNQLSFKAYSILSSYVAYIYFLTIPTLCISIDLGIRFIDQIINPSPFDIVRLNKLKTNNDLNIVKRLSAILDPMDVYEKYKVRNSLLFERSSVVKQPMRK